MTRKKPKHRITLDKSAHSIVVLCSECHSYRGFALDLVEAWQRADRHLLSVHRDNRQSTSALHRHKKK